MLRENLDRNFGFILHDVARLLRTTFDRRVRDQELGLTRSQWWVLTHLFRQEGITQSELAEVLDLEKASLGRLVDRLEANGWVRREACASDRRAKRIYLTDAVGPPMQIMRGIAAGVREDALCGLSDDDRDRFVDALLSIKANLVALDGTSGNGSRSR